MFILETDKKSGGAIISSAMSRTAI